MSHLQGSDFLLGREADRGQVVAAVPGWQEKVAFPGNCKCLSVFLKISVPAPSAADLKAKAHFPAATCVSIVVCADAKPSRAKSVERKFRPVRTQQCRIYFCLLSLAALAGYCNCLQKGFQDKSSGCVVVFHKGIELFICKTPSLPYCLPLSFYLFPHQQRAVSCLSLCRQHLAERTRADPLL